MKVFGEASTGREQVLGISARVSGTYSFYFYFYSALRMGSILRRKVCNYIYTHRDGIEYIYLIYYIGQFPGTVQEVHLNP